MHLSISARSWCYVALPRVISNPLLIVGSPSRNPSTGHIWRNLFHLKSEPKTNHQRRSLPGSGAGYLAGSGAGTVRETLGLTWQSCFTDRKNLGTSKTPAPLPTAWPRFRLWEWMASASSFWASSVSVQNRNRQFAHPDAKSNGDGRSYSQFVWFKSEKLTFEMPRMYILTFWLPSFLLKGKLDA